VCMYRLDVGEGKDLDLPECPRAKLKKQCIKYLGPVRIFPQWVSIFIQNGELYDCLASYTHRNHLGFVKLFFCSSFLRVCTSFAINLFPQLWLLRNILIKSEHVLHSIVNTIKSLQYELHLT